MFLGKSREILEMEAQAQAEGYVEGTKDYHDRLVYLKVMRCQEKLGVECSVCNRLMFCPLTQELYQIRSEKANKGPKK
jgi:hypothetical protein